MLPHPLALQRALRPLKRRVAAPRATVLDEHATADRIARLGAHPDVWLPVLRPAPDRWLRLNLVHDTGPTMPVWRPLVRELHTALAQSGVFRTITLHPAGPDGRARHVPDSDDGRTVTLVVSDCMGPQWRPGPAGDRWYRSLRRWARHMPLAVVQPLPERLWETTALPAGPGTLTAPATAAPAAALAFTPYDPEAPAPPPGAVPLPVLEPGPVWLANWAALIAAPGGRRTPGAVAWLPPSPVAPAEPVPDLAASAPEDLVLRFRATASPEAFRLAGHLALAVPSVPVMRLVQRAVDRDPRPQHLAEVILSGMLTAVPGPPGSYAFRPGVRELLLRTLPRTARDGTRDLLTRVGGLIDARAGLAAGEFRAQTAGGRDAGAAFAAVREETVRRLGGDTPERLVGGRYRLVRRRGGGMRLWDAVDERTGERVAVHLYPEQTAPDERFLRDARALADVASPHVAHLRDFGVEGATPYLVAEFTDGLTLAELVDGGIEELSFRVFARLVRQTVAGLDALHAHGLVRGQPGTRGLLLRPDGTVMISRFALGTEADGWSTRSDLAELAGMLRELARLVSFPPEHRQLKERIADGDPHEAARCAADVPTTADDRSAAQGFALLGPLTVAAGERVVTWLSPQAEALLCMLVLAHGRRVGLTELAEGLWDEPVGRQAAVDRLARLVAELRTNLRPSAVVALPDGYALHAPDAYVDVRHCEELLSGEPGHARVREALGLFRGDPLDAVPGPAARAARVRLRELRRELETRAAAEDRGDGAVILFETDDLGGRPEARIGLEVAVHEVLDRGAFGPHQYEVRVRANGYAVHTRPDAYLLPVLVAVLRVLPELTDAPRLRVTFWQPGALPAEVTDLQERADAGLQVVVPPSLYEEFAGSSAALGPQRFHPLHSGPANSPPIAWYCPPSEAAPEPEERDLVRGPFVTDDLRRLGIPVPGRTAIVHTGPDGLLTLLDPALPYGGGPPRPATYYEVDLTPQQSFHQVALPSSGRGTFAAAVDLTWHVDDPVAFVRGDTARVSERLLEHLLDTAPRVTRRHPVRRAGGAQRALHDALRRWPVPGLSVSCSVRLAPESAPPPGPPVAAASARSLPGLLARTETVLLGFDGPVVRLYSAQTAREATLDLLALVAEHRDPEDAFAGRLSTRALGTEAFPHPLDVLRTFAHDRIGPLLAHRLEELELRAVPDAPATHRSRALVRALSQSGRAVRIVTDVSSHAVDRCLAPFDLPLAGVHGRGTDLSRLMPHPDCLRRALGPREEGLLIGSSVAELTAAQQAGLPFVGYARTRTVEDQLRAAGCEITVATLEPLLGAVHDRG
jgi:beta-phosphoglucomutase-like phosphatase (HAD superfamily)